MVSPASRRRAAMHLLGLGKPRVRACRVSGLSRSGSRREPKQRNPGLRQKVLDLAEALKRGIEADQERELEDRPEDCSKPCWRLNLPSSQ